MSTSAPFRPAAAALVIMDYQTGILSRLGDGADPLVARTVEAIAAARAAGAEVAYVRVAFTDEDLESFPATSAMGARVAAAGRAMHADAPETQIDDRIAPQPGDVVVRKSRVGALSTTNLESQLRARGVDTLILAGVSTSGCVLSTVREAFDRDFRLLVLADGCADPEPGVHDFLLEQIFPRQAEVIDLAALRARLERA